MKSASVTAALDKIALTKKALNTSSLVSDLAPHLGKLVARIRSGAAMKARMLDFADDAAHHAIRGGAAGAGLGGAYGAVREKGEGEDRLGAVLRSAVTGAGTGAGLGVGARVGRIGTDGRSTSGALRQWAGGGAGALAGHSLTKSRAGKKKPTAAPKAEEKAPEKKEAPKETPVKKASLSKDAAVLRGVLEKQAFIGGLGRLLLNTGGRAMRGIGGFMGRAGLERSGKAVSGAGSKLRRLRVLAASGDNLSTSGELSRFSRLGPDAARRLNARLPAMRRAQTIAHVTGAGATGLGAVGLGSALLGGSGAPAPAQKPAKESTKAPKKEAPRETPVKKASLSKDAAVLRGVLEKQAIFGGIGRLLLNTGGRAMRRIGGVMGRAGLEDSGKMVSGAGSKLRRLGGLATAGKKLGATGRPAKRMVARMNKADPKVVQRLIRRIPEIQRAQGIAQLTGLGATGLGAGALLSGGGGGAPAPAQASAGITPEQMMLFQQMLQQGQGQGMNTSASPKNDGIQKAAVARELGRITAGTVLVKQAADRNFKVRTATFTLLAKKAGYRADEINAVVKSAALKKQAWLRKALGGLASLGALGGVGLGGYHLGKGLGWWGAAEDPTQKKMREFGEMMQKGQQMGLNPDQIKMIAGKDPRFAHMFASPAAGAAGAGAAGGTGQKWGAGMSKLFSRAGINPEQDNDMSDALQAMSYGADTRQQRGRALQNIARMNYSYGV